MTIMMNLMVGAIMIPDNDIDCDVDEQNGAAVLILSDHSNLKVPRPAIMNKAIRAAINNNKKKI